MFYSNIVVRRAPALAAIAAVGAIVALCGSSAPTRQSAGSDHTFTAVGSGGWQLISAPYTYSQSFQQMGLYTAAWQPQQNSYAVTPTPPADTFHLGQGYWAYLTNNTTLPAGTGSADTTQNFSILLQPGWNMVGDPFTNSIPLSNLYFVDNQTGLSTQFPAAVSGNGISPLYSYDPNAGSYTAVSDSGQSMQPWAGYWIYSFHTGSLSVDSSAGPAQDASETSSLLPSMNRLDNPAGYTPVPYVAGALLPPPSPSVANPRLVATLQTDPPVETGAPVIIEVQPPDPAGIVLLGVGDPGASGYYQIAASTSQPLTYQLTPKFDSC